MRERRVVVISLILAVGLGSACASASKDPFAGSKALDAVVVERQYDPPGTGGAGYGGIGNHYLLIEAREGDATSHYRFRVTQQLYNRFSEGSHVRIVVVDNDLRDIRLAD